MTTFIALLRGINVAGKNKIKMEDLKQLMFDLNFTKVTTYIQSGNIIFKATDNLSAFEVENLLLEAIQKKFNYTIQMVVLTKEQLNTIFFNNPFISNKAIETNKLHVTLLSKKSAMEVSLIKKLASPEEKYEIIKNTIYLYCPNGYSRTKLTNNNIEKKLKVSATTRNWKTIGKLVELSNLHIE